MATAEFQPSRLRVAAEYVMTALRDAYRGYTDQEVAEKMAAATGRITNVDRRRYREVTLDRAYDLGGGSFSSPVSDLLLRTYLQGGSVTNLHDELDRLDRLSPEQFDTEVAQYNRSWLTNHGLPVPHS